ncbi:hypothetical protein [Salimicrobium flavidum]|uniref:Uncharacterized protein n=1 Tax=Salimicrobium flavidum TaxID=570947 RepID=A0A1N7J738_9BACI|nr:hypothetical protein [Salimicrobium flavidum]SIS45077.1 hypothetical protein SAMN05421687_10443 [Salimicrobium flavidum]
MKKVVYLIGIVFVTLVFGMVITTPSESAFDRWVADEHGIQCEGDGNCQKGQQYLSFSSSHFKNAGVFVSEERTFEDSNGEETTIRTLGVFGQLIDMERGDLWEMLN